MSNEKKTKAVPAFKNTLKTAKKTAQIRNQKRISCVLCWYLCAF